MRNYTTLVDLRDLLGWTACTGYKSCGSNGEKVPVMWPWCFWCSMWLWSFSNLVTSVNNSLRHKKKFLSDTQHMKIRMIFSNWMWLWSFWNYVCWRYTKKRKLYLKITFPGINVMFFTYALTFYCLKGLSSVLSLANKP